MTAPTTVFFRAPLAVVGELGPVDRAADGAPAGPDAGGPIVLEGLAVPWGVTATMNAWGDTVTFRAGSIDPPNPAHVKLCLDHRPKPFGYGAAFESRPDGLWATMHVPRDELADPEVAAAVRQHANGVRDALSIGAAIVAADETIEGDGYDQTIAYDVTAARLLELSSVVVPLFESARSEPIAASADREAFLNRVRARHRAEPESESPTMTLTASTPVPGVPDPDPVDPIDPNGPDDPTARQSLVRAAAAAPTRPAGRARGRYASFGHWAHAVARGEVDATYMAIVEAAWADELTTDIPGIIPEQWLTDVIYLMGTVSTTVELFSRAPLPDSGMTLIQPVVTQGPDIGLVVGEKVEIPSRKVLIEGHQFPVNTFAGGQDISMQALLRSSPDYLNVLMTLYAQEMALQLNQSANAALLTGTTATVPAPTDPTDYNAWFIDAAAAILAATYRFPNVALLGTDWWVEMGKATGTDGRPLFPHLSPVNPVGTFAVNDGTGNVRGLDYAVDPSMPPGTAIVGVREAFRTWTSPMRTLSVDVPRLLGRDVAVFQFAAYGVTDARGLVELTLPAAGTARASSASKSAKS